MNRAGVAEQTRWWKVDSKTVLTWLIIILFGGGLILQLRDLQTPAAPYFVKVKDPGTGSQVLCVTYGNNVSCDWQGALIQER